MVGFGRDLGATRSLMDHDEPGQAITATQAAQYECELGLNDPLRRFKIWRRVGLLSPSYSCSPTRCLSG